MMQYILASLIFLKLCYNLWLVAYTLSVFSFTDAPPSHFNVNCFVGRSAYLLVRS